MVVSNPTGEHGQNIKGDVILPDASAFVRLTSSNPSAALSKLPKEIFSIIFEYGYDSTESGSAFLRSICLTCRAWYALAISLPRLWTTLYIEKESSFARTELWIARSRSLPLSISVPMKGIGPEYVTRCPEYAMLLGTLIVTYYTRWRVALIDCLHSDGSSRRVWLDAIQNREATLLEELTFKWSGEMPPIPPTSTFPKLRKLRMERMACNWAPFIMGTAHTTLKRLSLFNMDVEANGFDLPAFWDALKELKGLEELKLDEVVWEAVEGEGGDDDEMQIALPFLRTLKLTAVTNINSLLGRLRLPGLVHLAIGDIQGYGDLSRAFLHLARYSNGDIECLTTGMWDMEDPENQAEELDGAASPLTTTEKALLDLISKQPRLRELVIEDAGVGEQFVRWLTIVPPASVPVPPTVPSSTTSAKFTLSGPSPTASSSASSLPTTPSPPNASTRNISPLLESLVIPMCKLSSSSSVLEMARSRAMAANGQRLLRLVLTICTSQLCSEYGGSAIGGVGAILGQITGEAIAVWVDKLELDVIPDPDAVGPDMESEGSVTESVAEV